MKYSGIWGHLSENTLDFKWSELDWLAAIDGIQPATGEEMGKVLLKMHGNKIVKHDEPVGQECVVVGPSASGQIVGWDWDKRQPGRFPLSQAGKA